MITSIIFIALLFLNCRCAVIGIDLGSEYIKIGIIKRGSPIDVVLNEQSKRKIESLIGFSGKERYYGFSSLNFKARKPFDTIQRVNILLGEEFSNFESKNLYNEIFQIPIELLENEKRKTIDVKLKSGGEIFSPEEILSMILNYVREISEKQGKGVSNAVICVPSYFTIHQRQAILDACELSNIKVYAILNEGTALGVQYGITKYRDIKKSKGDHHVLFYDLGSSSLKVSIGTFFPPKKEISSDLGELRMRSFTWSRKVGGAFFDSRLAKFLAQKFEEIHHIDVSGDKKVMAKLFHHANKVKKMLTINSEAQVSIESLYDDLDLRVVVRRDEFEEICSDLFEYLTLPVKECLENSGISLEEIKSVEFFGGTSRIPFVEKIVKKFVGEKIQHSLNADEAVALGSVFYAASLSPMFRVKTFKINDIFPYKVDFFLSPKKTDEENKSKPAKVYSLFKKYEIFGTKKSINIPRNTNVSLTLSYSEGSVDSFGRPLGEFVRYDIKGVDTVMEKWKEKHQLGVEKTTKAKIRISFVLEKTGVVKMTESIATLEREVEVQEKVKKKKEEKETVEKEEEKIEKKKEDVPPTTPEEGKEEEKVEKTEEEIKKEEEEEKRRKEEEKKRKEEEEYEFVTKKKKKYSRVSLKTKVEHLLLPPFSDEMKFEAKKRIREYDVFEKNKFKMSKARNDLESFIYNSRYTILEDEDLKHFYTEETKTKLEKEVEVAEDWLIENEDNNDLGIEEFIDRLDELRKGFDVIISKQREYVSRHKQIQRCSTIFNRTIKAVDKILKTKPYINQTEVMDLLKKFNETRDWIIEKMELQKDVPLYEDPVVKATEISRMCSTLKSRYSTLLRRRPPPKPKNKTVKAAKKGEKVGKEKEGESEKKTEETVEKEEEGESEKKTEETVEKEEKVNENIEKTITDEKENNKEGETSEL